MQKGFLLVFILFFGAIAFAQQVELSPASKISVLTCGPGEILYTAFGHSAIRVQDPAQKIDVVYNYGVFDASGTQFYYEFSQGRMDYLLARNYFTDFLYEYKTEGRWVKEQELHIDLAERNALFLFLENNARPENRVYKYDYLLNNCATKIWDVQKEVFGDKLIYNEQYIDTTYTFRELMRHNLQTNSWGQFGIDLALGSAIDRKATPLEHMFLPKYVSKQLKSTKLNGQLLCPNETELISAVEQDSESNFFLTPLFWFVFVLIITILITYKDFKNNKRSRWFDFILFFVIGLHGLLIFYLWFLTDHIWTVNNFNILWLFPLNSFAAFFLLKKTPPNWLLKYLTFLLFLIVIMLVLWIFKLQSFSVLIIPLLLVLITRYLFLYNRFSFKQ
ncbi:DUF4105 domain-containing protein [Aurantibacter crassamenti]|nr:DUF4105 domain-containing protein [Aurantibacter crassamenti]